jgi:hypothetical protein
MEVLAIKQVRILLDLVEEDADLVPYIATISPEHRLAILFLLKHIIKDIK